jgi:uncharacterized protein YacL (UPF0231 family)
MQAEEKLKKELQDMSAEIDKAERKLKALRRHPTEVSKGKTRVSFITSKEQMVEAAELAKQLDSLRRREREIQNKLQSRTQ